MSDVRLAVVGADGKMGRMLVRAIAETEGISLGGALERAGSPALGNDAGTGAGLPPLGVLIVDDPDVAFRDCDGIVDFTVPAATLSFLDQAVARKMFHVIGTTGLSESDLARIAAAGRTIPIVRSGNMSLGVNLLAALVRRAARTLGADFDIEIVEMHHRHKVDAPSGTALLLGEAAAAGRAIALKDHSVRVRDGYTGSRRPGDIGFATLRGGSVVGDHSVILAGPGERLTLSHQAEDRALFAKGAMRAAQWLKGRAPGVHSMADVLDLTD